MSAFLGVERSVLGRRWLGPDGATERVGLAISQQAEVPELVGRILAARGVLPEEAADYLSPTLRGLMPNPSVLRDLDTAAERLAMAVQKRQRVAIFGDYDVDGGASTALLVDWLRQLGLEATPYIPDRIDEGYGPNEAAMSALAARHDLILCVDCGTLSHGPIRAATGADVIVADHHLAGETLPEALAIVNPNRPDDNSGLGYLCAAGVVFMLLVAANRALRGKGFFGGRREPDLMAMLDLVALATVADVAPLTGLNRAFVRQGLSVLSRRARPGLAALADISGLSAPPTSRDLGFALGPRINAGGRVGAADLGMRLLAAADPHEAGALAQKLDDLNRERREIEAHVLATASEQIEQRGADGPLVWAAAEGWHPGVVGIVASRLKDKYHRPAIVIGVMDGEGKGSGRSVPGIDLGRSVAALTHKGLLLKGGGHMMAAGLTVAPDKIEPAMAELARLMQDQGPIPEGPGDLRLDGVLMPGAATADLVQSLEAAGPFGPANPPPLIAFSHVRVDHTREVGQGHCQVRLSAGEGKPLDAIAFRAADNGLMAFFDRAREGRAAVHVAGLLEIDDWGGRRRAKLRIEDADFA
ncbi:single-stranded-DNA-specific exonuclease RecJ [Rhodobacteraceae bacterium NNCM2]|nr:single-stranded-DNA-specific exonuclease RecJ [Coraliihabitans acroporae]